MRKLNYQCMKYIKQTYTPKQSSLTFHSFISFLIFRFSFTHTFFFFHFVYQTSASQSQNCQFTFDENEHRHKFSVDTFRKIKSSWKSIPFNADFCSLCFLFRFFVCKSGKHNNEASVILIHYSWVGVPAEETTAEIRLPPQISVFYLKAVIRTHFKINWHFFHWIWLMIQSLVRNHHWDLLHLCINALFFKVSSRGVFGITCFYTLKMSDMSFNVTLYLSGWSCQEVWVVRNKIGRLIRL